MGRLDVSLAWNCSGGEASCRFVERQVPLELFLFPPPDLDPVQQPVLR